MKLYQINEINSVMCDAIVTRENELMFGSFWGRDTAILECLSRFQLPALEGGINTITIDDQLVRINAANLQKQSGRFQHSLYGNMIHLWLYSPRLIEPDIANCSMSALIRLQADAEKPDEDLITKTGWNLLNQVCPYPLLAEWEFPVVTHLLGQGYLTVNTGLNVCTVDLNLDADRFGEFLMQSIQSGLLWTEV